MGKQLKVWGGLTQQGSRQVRTIIAAHSRKAAAEQLKISQYAFSLYWGQTNNAKEIEVATARPNTVFVASTSMGFDFVEMSEAGNRLSGG